MFLLDLWNFLFGSEPKPAFTLKEEFNQADIDDDILDHPIFHGFLPDEDVRYVLNKPGDWLVRLARPRGEGIATNDLMMVTVMIRVPKDCCNYMNPLANFAINEEDDGDYTFEHVDRTFRTLPKLFYFIGRPEFKLDVILAGAAVSVQFERMTFMTRFELVHNQIEKIKELGSGAYGEVHLAEVCYHKGHKSTVALKTILDDTEDGEEIVAEVMQEARLMRELTHPNIVRLLGIAIAERPVYVALEFVSGGALDSFLRRNADELTILLRTRIALAATKGLAFLHDNCVIHRDVAARNCLYDHRHLVKISDFGLSRKLDYYKMAQPKKMPVKWMAPESIVRYEFTMASDVFSFGNLIYEIYTSLEPHHDKTSGQARMLILRGEQLKFDAAFPAFVHDVKSEFWAFQQSERPTMYALVKVFCTGLTAVQAAATLMEEETPETKRETSTTVARKKHEKRQRRLERKQRESIMQQIAPIVASRELIAIAEAEAAKKLTPRELALEKRKRREEFTEDDIVGPSIEELRPVDASCGRMLSRSASRARRMRRRASRSLASRLGADVVLVGERPSRRRPSQGPPGTSRESAVVALDAKDGGRRRRSKAQSSRHD